MANNEKYRNFVIYKIYPIDSQNDFLYIGSTTNFSSRKSKHKKNTYNRSSKAYRYPIYQFIRAIGGWDKMVCEILEKYPCGDKKTGLMREKELILFYHANLNINNPIYM